MSLKNVESNRRSRRSRAGAILALVACVGALGTGLSLLGWNPVWADSPNANQGNGAAKGFDRVILANITTMTQQGQQTFRFDTFGDEVFWGDQLQLHRAIEGSKFGGVGGGLTPKAALALGLKVDVDALPGRILGELRSGRAKLDDPATTLALLQANA